MTRPAAVALAAAIHEAGHAVASWRQGDGIGKVSIEPSTDPETGACIGGRFTMLRGGDQSLASGWGHRHLIVLFAGPAAQHRHDPRSCVRSCAVWDFSSARAFAGIMTRSYEAERALLTWAQAEARVIISDDWPLVEVLARALIEAVTIDGATAAEILASADRARRPGRGHRVLPAPRPSAGTRPRHCSSLSGFRKPKELS